MSRNHVFVYEFITGGGWWSVSNAAPPESLLREGYAMSRALADDLNDAGNVVYVLSDRRFDNLFYKSAEILAVSTAEEERRAFMDLARSADWTIVIAPEFNNLLWERTKWVEQQGGRLASPGSDWVRRAADKWELQRRLRSANVPVPRSWWLGGKQSPPADCPFPAVVKRRDGAGSLGVQRVDRADQPIDWTDLPDGALWESYCPGRAVSVAVLTGPLDYYYLPPAEQHQTQDGRFEYLGGRVPLESESAARVHRLARLAMKALPPTRGFVGIDLVLGACQDEDVVIEVNPRLTTSYVGLRRLASENLGSAMLAAASGRPISLSFHAGPITFTADGTILEDPT